MFCFQCQESANNSGCTLSGVCGKTPEVANLQDLLIFLVKGISQFSYPLIKQGVVVEGAGKFIADSLFMTITNANFDKDRFVERVMDAYIVRERAAELFDKYGLDRSSITFEGLFGKVRVWMRWRQRLSRLVFWRQKMRIFAL